jgi:hypothetical protein
MGSIGRAIALIAISGSIAATSFVSDADARRRDDGCGGPGECKGRQVYRYDRSPGCGGSGQCDERRYRRYRPQVYGCGGPGQCRDDRTYIRRRPPPAYYYEDPIDRYDYGYDYDGN